MEIKKLLERYYEGDTFEKKSIVDTASPAIKFLLKTGDFDNNYNTTILDYFSGKYPRNADFLRSQGLKVYAYDPKSDGQNGWKTVSNKLPNQVFNSVITTYVLNSVSQAQQEIIIDECEAFAADHVYHIVRNKDIIKMVETALKRKDKLITDFFLNNFANDEEKENFEKDILSDDTIYTFCKYGVKNSKGFQRLVELEDYGYRLLKTTYNYKIYVNN